MKKMIITIIGILALSILFPIFQSLIFWLRFGNIKLYDNLVFLPVGLISGIVLFFILNLNIPRKRKVHVVLFYLAAIPFAIISSLFSGLIINPVIGVSTIGTLPLLIGIGLGYWIP